MTAFWFSLGISWIRWSQQAGGVSAGAFPLTLKLRKSQIENMGNGKKIKLIIKLKKTLPYVASFYAHMRWHFSWFHESIFNRTEMETLLSHLKVTWRETKIFLSIVRQKNMVRLDWKWWGNAALYPEGEGLSRLILSLKWKTLKQRDLMEKRNLGKIGDSSMTASGVAALGVNLPKVRNSTALLLGMT